MRKILYLFKIIVGLASDLSQVVGYIFTFLSALFCSRVTLATRVLAAESQLAACKRRIEKKDRPRPRFTQAFRLLWVLLSKAWDQWHQVAHLMQPATLKRWHTTAFRVYWRRKSKGVLGRPPVSKEMRVLIRRLSRENPLWSAERIGDTLRLLGCDPPCRDSIRKYMSRPKTSDQPTNWLPFLRNHLSVSWAMDFFTVVTLNFSFLYVFVVFEHGRRRVIHFSTTYHPSMTWVIQQLREATPFGRKPRYLFRDNDGIYGHGVRRFLDSCNIEEVRTFKLLSFPICGGLHHRYERVAA